MSALREEIMLLAEQELFEDELEQQAMKREKRRSQNKGYAIIASGVLLSSLMSATAGGMIGSTQYRVLSAMEANAISDLMDYVAYKMHAPRDWVEEVVLAEFRIASLDQLQARQYDDVIVYLLKLVH